jgi:hypothetical protein
MPRPLSFDIIHVSTDLRHSIHHFFVGPKNQDVFGTVTNEWERSHYFFVRPKTQNEFGIVAHEWKSSHHYFFVGPKDPKLTGKKHRQSSTSPVWNSSA